MSCQQSPKKQSGSLTFSLFSLLQRRRVKLLCGLFFLRRVDHVLIFVNGGL